jgi:hypothetical protein
MQRPAYLIAMTFILICFAGCSAMIRKSVPDEPSEIASSATQEEITKRFGSPIASTRLEFPIQGQRLKVPEPRINLLNSQELAASKTVFAFKGRLDSKARAGQAGFDSFMTLGLAELYLIPKAIWERSTDEDLQLTVWFSSNGQAVAYQWDQRKSH